MQTFHTAYRLLTGHLHWIHTKDIKWEFSTYLPCFFRKNKLDAVFVHMRSGGKRPLPNIIASFILVETVMLNMRKSRKSKSGIPQNEFDERMRQILFAVNLAKLSSNVSSTSITVSNVMMVRTICLIFQTLC